jgi:hypothetical protein
VCKVNYSVFLLRISFFIYIYNICMPGMFHATEKDNAARVCDSVPIVFISLWKLKFLAYLLNVTKHFFMRIISYANVVYFICM